MTIPALAECIAKVEQISHTSSKGPSKDISDLYVASVGLLCHLKVDQATLVRAV